MKKIVFVFFDAGGGHRSAATSLEEVIAKTKLDWDVELVNLQEILDSIDFVRSLTGIRIQDVYNRMLRNGWTLGSPQLMRMLQGCIFLFHPQTVRLLEKLWREIRPDLVASVVPHFNLALFQSLRGAAPQAAFVTILTDIADYPPHFWIERQSQYFVCGSERAVEQARRIAGAGATIFRTSGMILNPRFYNYARVDREAERQKLGLHPELKTALVLFGGQGASGNTLEIEKRLRESNLPVQLILICGRNEALARKLRSIESTMPRVVEGFTNNVPYYMQLADFFIGKPGPGSLAEALAMGLPVIVERNAWTLPQERYNTEWVREKQVGLVLRSFSQISTAVSELLEPEAFSRFRRNAEAMENRALFEIPEFLQKILEGRASSGAVLGHASDSISQTSA